LQPIRQVDLDGAAAGVGQHLGQEGFQAGTVGEEQVSVVDGCGTGWVGT